MADWDDVRRIALALPETTERPSRDHAHWWVRGKGFVWERPLGPPTWRPWARRPRTGRSSACARPPHRQGGADRRRPEVFFTTPHFDGYPAVLVRLERIGVTELEELIVDAWLARAPKRLAQAYLDDTSA